MTELSSSPSLLQFREIRELSAEGPSLYVTAMLTLDQVATAGGCRRALADDCFRLCRRAAGFKLV
jgi:hypothetical protein